MGEYTGRWFGLEMGASCDTGGGSKVTSIVNPVTSENLEGVGAIGSHMASLLTIFTIKLSTHTSPVRLWADATAIILQQITGEDIMTGPLANLANFPFCR